MNNTVQVCLFYGQTVPICMNKPVNCAALHCIALHCIALHCIALHPAALHCISLHSMTLDWKRLTLLIVTCVLVLPEVATLSTDIICNIQETQFHVNFLERAFRLTEILGEMRSIVKRSPVYLKGILDVTGCNSLNSEWKYFTKLM